MTRPTTAFRRGEVILVGFMFSDTPEIKRRPALIVSSEDYSNQRRELVVAAITSNVGRRLFGDHLVVDWRGAGLLFPSTVTAILRTISQGLVHRKLGAMAHTDVEAFSGQLRRALNL